MVARACAVWLVLLIVAPFSAPFSVCDVSTFVGVAQTQSTSGPVKSSRTLASLADATTHTLPVVRTIKRVKATDAVQRPLPWLHAPSHAPSSQPFSPVPFAKSPLAAPLRI
jgi:hypothetical protein